MRVTYLVTRQLDLQAASFHHSDDHSRHHDTGTQLRLAIYSQRQRHKKGSPYSITERRAPELIPVHGSQPAGDVNHKPGGRLPLLSARPAVTPATIKRAATNLLLGEQRHNGCEQFA